MTDKPNTAMADAFFGIFGLRRIEMRKRDGEKDLAYLLLETPDSESDRDATINELEIISNHWVRRAMIAELGADVIKLNERIAKLVEEN